MRTVEILAENNLGELKPICIENVMEVVEIGKQLGELLLFAKIFLPPLFFNVQYVTSLQNRFSTYIQLLNIEAIYIYTIQ